MIEEPLDAAKKLFLSWDTTVQLPSLSFDLDPTEYSVVLELTNFTKTGTSTINGFVAIEIECHSDTKNVSVHVPQHGMKINMERIYIKEVSKCFPSIFTNFPFNNKMFSRANQSGYPLLEVYILTNKIFKIKTEDEGQAFETIIFLK